MKKIFLLAVLMWTTLSFAALRKDNALYLCENGLEMLDLDITLIRQAKSSIEIQACIFGGDICQRLLDELAKRLSEVGDLQVYIAVAPILIEIEDRAKIDQLKALYPNRFHLQYQHDIPLILPNIALMQCHSKFVIIDERYFSIGGTNLEESLCNDGTFTPPKKPRPGIARANIQAGARDQDVVGVGPLATELRRVFFTVWTMWQDAIEGKTFDLDPEHVKDRVNVPTVPEDKRCFSAEFESNPKLISMPSLKFIFSGPMHKPNHIAKEYIRLIQGAKKEIVMAHLYFNPSTEIFEALKQASARGVSTTLITNGARETSPMSATYFSWANRINYVPLFYGRDYHFWETWKAASDPVRPVKIHEYAVKNIMYHKKVLVVDRHLIIIGSFNLGVKSDKWDYETVVVIDSEEMAADLLKIIERDKSLSAEVTPSEARNWYFDPIKSFLGMHQKQLHTLL